MNKIIQTKICTKCGEEKEISFFHKAKLGKHGVVAWCKDCCKIWQLENKEMLQIANSEYRKNNKEIIAIRDKKYRNKNIEKLSLKQKKYYEQNKEKISLQKKEYDKNNKEKISLRRKEYYQLNKEKISLAHKKYHQKNYDALYAKQKEYNHTFIGKMIKKNTRHKRRAIEKKGDVTTAQLMELQQNTKVCYWCGCNLKNVKKHLDHYIPLSKGGKHTLSNLVMSCSKCNQLKSSKDPIEFANSLGKLL